METETIALRGGLDLVTPAVAKAPGSLIGGFNYECDAEGYRRFIGYERLDGRGKPSEASYWVLGFDQSDTAVSAGDTVTGGTSGATGIALIDGVVESGAYGTSDAAGYLVLYDVSGTFQDNENLEVSASTVAVADGIATERGAGTDANDRTWLIAAQDERRALIAKPTGSGPVRGVAYFDGAWWCVRDNAGATAGVLYKATTSGWAAQDLGRYIAFTSGGTTEIEEGDTVTGATSSASATVERVILTSGSWSGGDAAGYLILSGQSGNFQSENLDNTTESSTNDATIGGDSTANALPAGGRYEFVVHNFYGAARTERLYGVNGVGRAFEWDGTVFSPVWTGLSDALDKPNHVAEFSDHLFLGYAAGAIQFSEPGEPLHWRGALDAGEIATGSAVTGLVRSTTALIVFGASRVDYLVGPTAADFEYRAISEDSGATRWTAVEMDQPLYIGDKAVRSLEATQAFGGWRRGALSGLIEPVFDAITARDATPKAVVAARKRDLIRWFYSDGTAIVGFFGRQAPEFTTLELGMTVECAWGDENGLVVGDSTGWVYELDMGDTADGEDIEAMARLATLHLRSPRMNKRFHGATLEIVGTGDIDLSFAAEFDYGDPALPAGTAEDFTVRGGGGYWDTANWNNFQWSAQVVGEAIADIQGIGRNVSMAIRATGSDEPAHVLSALYLDWSPRGATKRRV